MVPRPIRRGCGKGGVGDLSMAGAELRGGIQSNPNVGFHTGLGGDALLDTCCLEVLEPLVTERSRRVMDALGATTQTGRGSPISLYTSAIVENMNASLSCGETPARCPL